MGNEWQRYIFEDCMEAIIDYRGKTPKKTNAGIPLVTAKIIKNGAIQPVNEYIAEENYVSWMRRGIPEPGDVVLTTEAPLGEVAQLDNRKVALAQRVITLRGKKDFLDNTFLKYLLLSNDVQHQLDGRGTGTTVKGIKQSELRKLELPIPDYKTQKSIAHIIGTLDNKIQLNRQTNQTLEQMAQALFKSWFVDFDPVIDNALAAGKAIPAPFQKRAEQRAQQRAAAKPSTATLPDDIRQLFPCEFEHTEELGWVPLGWRATTLKSFGKIITGKTPSKSIDHAYDSVGIPFITPTDIGGSAFIIKTNRYLTKVGADTLKNNKVLAGSICVTCIGSQMGKTIVSPSAAYTNQQINSINPTKEFYRDYVFFNLRQRRDEIFSLGASGSTMPILNKSSFSGLLMLKPSDNVLMAFDNLNSSCLTGILHNDNHSLALEKLRDTLLPKLISGELRLPPEAQG